MAALSFEALLCSGECHLPLPSQGICHEIAIGPGPWGCFGPLPGTVPGMELLLSEHCCQELSKGHQPGKGLTGWGWWVVISV